MSFFSEINIGLAINAIAVILVWLQLRQNYKLERASFASTLNNDLNQFIDVRIFLKENNSKEKLSNIKIEKYERVLDYFTAFENIKWMINLKVLTAKEAKDYFGSRFNEAFNSEFFKINCDTDQSFRLMYSMMFDLNDIFNKTSVA